ncbi:MAG TPA: hypothetical protein VFX92_00165 [Candidatus Krumholzibacteria bacterium]|nr:hypothetical protein [Candidatus Krumholzibacteria bacterium]
MNRRIPWLFILGALTVSACASHNATAQTAPCSMTAASPWIEHWLDAWTLVSDEILHISDARPPLIVFYDSTCVYTNSAVTAGGRPPVDGPTLRGAALPWRALPHDTTITLPDSSQVPIALMSFTNVAHKTQPYFVMAAPSFWEPIVGPDSTQYTGVFLHEFTHTRQIRGIGKRIGPIDSTWAYPEELNDDAVQTHFGTDSVYVAAYLAERDLLYRAADADSLTEVRALAAQALAMIRARHARYFTGDKAEFAELDNVFMSLEGAGQWVAVAWLSHPDGGKLTRDAAVKKMLGRRRWWVQDESLAIFLVVDRLLPNWPQLVFDTPSSIGALDLLDRAVNAPVH